MLAEALLVALTVNNGPGTDDCLSAARLRSGVERRLRRRVFSDAKADAGLAIEVTFERREREIEARIAIASADGTPRGTRSLVAEGHCSRLDDSLALSVALLVDQPPDPEPPEAPSPPPAPAAAPPSAPVAAPRTKPSPIAIPPEVPAPREPWHFRLGVALSSAYRVLPTLSPAVMARVTLEPSRFIPITLHGEAFARSSAERDSSSGARFRLWRVGLHGCPRLLADSALTLGICFGQKLSWIDAEGFGFDHDARDGSLAIALTGGGEGRLALTGPVWLRGYVGGEAALVRDRFSTGGSRPVQLFRASPLAVAAEIGAEVELW